MDYGISLHLRKIMSDAHLGVFSKLLWLLLLLTCGSPVFPTPLSNFLLIISQLFIGMFDKYILIKVISHDFQLYPEFIGEKS